MKTGHVIRPEYGSGDGTVTLTATLAKGSAKREVTFKATVKEAGMTDTQCVAHDKAALIIAGMDSIITNLQLPSLGEQGSTITWESNAAGVISNTGVVVRPENGAADGKATMTATIKKGVITETKTFECVVKAWTNLEEVELDVAAITWDSIKNLNISKTEVTTDLTLATKGARGSDIAWSSTNTSVMNINGKLTRPSWKEGETTFSLTAIVSKGVGDTVTKTVYILALKAKALPISNLEAVNLATGYIEPELFKGTNASFPSVTDNMTLPKTVKANVDCASVSLTWELIKSEKVPDLSNPNVSVTDKGDSFLCSIARPLSTGTNGSAILQVTLSSSVASGDEISSYKSFTLTIPKMV